jgi:hypothetical protein
MSKSKKDDRIETPSMSLEDDNTLQSSELISPKQAAGLGGTGLKKLVNPLDLERLSGEGGIDRREQY